MTVKSALWWFSDHAVDPFDSTSTTYVIVQKGEGEKLVSKPPYYFSCSYTLKIAFDFVTFVLSFVEEAWNHILADYKNRIHWLLRSNLYDRY